MKTFEQFLEIPSCSFRDDSYRTVAQIPHKACEREPACLPLYKISIHDHLDASGYDGFESFVHRYEN